MGGAPKSLISVIKAIGVTIDFIILILDLIYLIFAEPDWQFFLLLNKFFNLRGEGDVG